VILKSEISYLFFAGTICAHHRAQSDTLRINLLSLEDGLNPQHLLIPHRTWPLSWNAKPKCNKS